MTRRRATFDELSCPKHSSIFGREYDLRPRGGQGRSMKLSQFTGLKGVLLCDGGCDALNRPWPESLQPRCQRHHVRIVVDYKSVGRCDDDAGESDRSGRSGPDHLAANGQGLSLAARTVQLTPLVGYLSERLHWNYHIQRTFRSTHMVWTTRVSPSYGGGTMGGQSIKMFIPRCYGFTL